MANAARAQDFVSSTAPRLLTFPHTAMTASPMNLSSVPPFSKTTAVMRLKYSLSCLTSASGSAFSVLLVKPTISEKRIVAGMRTPRRLL